MNPFQTRKTNILNKYDLTGLSLRINCDENFHSNSDNIRQVIRVSTSGIPKDQSIDNENNIDTYD